MHRDNKQINREKEKEITMAFGLLADVDKLHYMAVAAGCQVTLTSLVVSLC